MADNQASGSAIAVTSGGAVAREYRKGNWTVGETMILIEAKKMDDERRMKRTTSALSEAAVQAEGSSSPGAGRVNKPAELRWKWVEDYCWRKACLRSQNQCNDKWDNLMRDYKKVRDFEKIKPASQPSDHHHHRSYWKMDKSERKDRNLPTNMLPQIYEALVEVVEKKAASFGTGSPVPVQQVVQHVAASSAAVVHHQHQQQQQPQVAVMAAHQTPVPVMLQRHIAASPLQAQPPLQYFSQPQPQPQPVSPTVDSDTSEHSDSPAKRQRTTTTQPAYTIHHAEKTTISASQRNVEALSPSSHVNEVANAISKSASAITEALRASEEREERRHRELMSLHEINRQGINGLVEAINNLVTSIQALASKQPPS